MLKKATIIITFLLILNNCLSLTYIDFPKNALEDSEQIVSIIKSNKTSFSSNQIDIRKINYNERLNSPGWGVIGFFNLCLLIPCVDKYETEIEITYSFKGKVLEKEKIKGHSYLVGSVLFLFPYSIFFPNEDKKIKEKFENKIAPYIQSKLFEVEEKKKIFEESFAHETKEFSTSKNKKCKRIYDFRKKYSELFNEEQKESISNEFTTCIENRVKSLALKNYPFLKSHLSREIYFQYESSTYMLIDLFNTIYLYSPEKLKLDNFNYGFYKENNNKFYMKIQNTRGDLIVKFEIKNDKVYCLSIESYNEFNPRGWESIVNNLFQKFYEFPQNDDLWNWELIDAD